MAPPQHLDKDQTRNTMLRFTLRLPPILPTLREPPWHSAVPLRHVESVAEEFCRVWHWISSRALLERCGANKKMYLLWIEGAAVRLHGDVLEYYVIAAVF